MDEQIKVESVLIRTLSNACNFVRFSPKHCGAHGAYHSFSAGRQTSTRLLACESGLLRARRTQPSYKKKACANLHAKLNPASLNVNAQLLRVRAAASYHSPLASVIKKACLCRYSDPHAVLKPVAHQIRNVSSHQFCNDGQRGLRAIPTSRLIFVQSRHGALGAR